MVDGRNRVFGRGTTKHAVVNTLILLCIFCIQATHFYMSWCLRAADEGLSAINNDYQNLPPQPFTDVHTNEKSPKIANRIIRNDQEKQSSNSPEASNMRFPASSAPNSPLKSSDKERQIDQLPKKASSTAPQTLQDQTRQVSQKMRREALNDRLPADTSSNASLVSSNRDQLTSDLTQDPYNQLQADAESPVSPQPNGRDGPIPNVPQILFELPESARPNVASNNPGLKTLNPSQLANNRIHEKESRHVSLEPQYDRDTQVPDVNQAPPSTSMNVSLPPYDGERPTLNGTHVSYSGLRANSSLNGRENLTSNEFQASTKQLYSNRHTNASFPPSNGERQSGLDDAIWLRNEQIPKNSSSNSSYEIHDQEKPRSHSPAIKVVQVPTNSSSNTSQTSHDQERGGLNVSLASVDQELEARRTLLVDTFRQVTGNASKILPRVFRRTRTNGHSITATVFLGTSKFERFLYSIRRWGGLVSAAVYISSEDQISELVEFYHQNANDLALTDLHVLFEREDVIGFPYNVLRQSAVDFASTEFFLTLDVDFVTPPNASDGLNALLQSRPKVSAELRKKTVLVLPAFERTADVTAADIVLKADQVLPQNKDELRKLVNQNEMQMFHPDWKPGHRVTDFPRWLQNPTANRTLTNPYYYIDYEMYYEPYVIACKHAPGLPKYWEGFRGYEHNKLSWFTDLFFSGFRLAVLKEWFVVHLEHVREVALRLPQSDGWNEEFRDYMKKKFKWDDDTYTTVFTEHWQKDFDWSTNITHPKGIPVLVNWKVNRGTVFGRVYDNAGISALPDYKGFLGTSSILKGDAKKGNIIRTKSGRSFYLGEKLRRRRWKGQMS